jgi:hypothetical protein
MLIAFVAFRPELLHKMPDSDARAFPTPRSWAQVSKICAAPDSLRPALVRSLVGEGAAGEFEAFVRVFRRLPRIDELLAAPLTAPVPDEREPALLYAICSALARKATRENFGAVIAYAERLPRDFTVLLTTDAIRRDRALSETRAYVDFVTRNGGAI